MVSAGAACRGVQIPDLILRVLCWERSVKGSNTVALYSTKEALVDLLQLFLPILLPQLFSSPPTLFSKQFTPPTLSV